MNESRSYMQKAIFALTLFVCAVVIAAVLYDRFGDSRVETLISHPADGGILPPSIPLPEKRENPQAPVPTAEPKERPGAPMQATTGRAAPPRSVTAGTDAVTRTVAAFYSDYIRFLASENNDANTDAPQSRENSNLSREAKIVDFLYSRPDVRVGFAEKIDRQLNGLVKKGMKNAPNYDPVLSTRAIPLEMHYSDPSFAQNRADIIAYAVWESQKRSPICVSLLKIADLWQIDDITAMNLSDGNALCGGKRAVAAPESAGRSQTGKPAAPGRSPASSSPAVPRPDAAQPPAGPQQLRKPETQGQESKPQSTIKPPTAPAATKPLEQAAPPAGPPKPATGTGKPSTQAPQGPKPATPSRSPQSSTPAQASKPIPAAHTSRPAISPAASQEYVPPARPPKPTGPAQASPLAAPVRPPSRSTP